MIRTYLAHLSLSLYFIGKGITLHELFKKQVDALNFVFEYFIC